MRQSVNQIQKVQYASWAWEICIHIADTHQKQNNRNRLNVLITYSHILLAYLHGIHIPLLDYEVSPAPRICDGVIQARIRSSDFLISKPHQGRRR